MKNQRHELILEIINSQPVSTQEMLIELLAKRGVRTTQATLSRDIQQLSLVKQRDTDGNYRYTFPTAVVEEKNFFAESV
ncbi:MAG: ArgR family transcriptional regulator, partial [Ruminococcus sp.]|nr:ArgR family transcriptional regulator [Ruminococcus sp.]